MLVLGLQGSPRIKGNTGVLLDAFLDEARRLGAATERLDAARKDISPCLECGSCEKEGFCPIDDDMQETYHLLWQADIVVMATPIFFYGPTAQLKALIDRCQTPWSRRYVHKLSDPGRTWRRGVMLSVGATKGKNLFDGTRLTAQYFFDAFGANFTGSLTFRKIESAGEIRKHPTALADARAEARAQVSPLLKRKKILFVSQKDASFSQMAGAFARYHGGDRFDVKSAGREPADQVDQVMIEVMGEKGIDMAFKKTQSVEMALKDWQPDTVVSLGKEHGEPRVSKASQEQWHLTSPSETSVGALRGIRGAVEEKVKRLLAAL